MFGEPTPDSTRRHIVIVGAGFSGTATAVQLLRRYGDLPLHISLVNRHPDLGRGVAYGTHSPYHLLNVPAGRMSLFPEDPDDFLHYAREEDPRYGGGDFLPRSLYGRYLASRLQQASDAASRAVFQHVTGEVVDLVLAAEGARAILRLRSGARLECERVVLTTGNYAPADPPIPAAAFFAGSPLYVRDPWERNAFGELRPVEPTLLIGTGLTMVDVALELRRRGFTGRLHALSRRGLLPQAHRQHSDPPLVLPRVLERLREGPATVRNYLHTVRSCIAEIDNVETDWRDVIGALRPATAELWQYLDATERRRFLRHLQPYWDTHRHRMAPAAAERLAAELESGGLEIGAGRLLSLEEQADGYVRVNWRPRGTSQVQQLRVGAVINCTGPQSRLEKIGDRLIQSLLSQGLMRADVLELGVETDAADSLLDAQGKSSKVIYYTGPLLRARYWECTAVPELRAAAARLATRLTEGLHAPVAS